MARCGACGILKEDQGLGKPISGECLWYHMEVPTDALFEHRDCDQFHKKLSGWSASDHWDYARQRSDMHDGFKAAQKAVLFSIISLVVAVGSLVLKI
tara:strand:+ start:1307 stop:1597 length:291 start_codon:yes stop_codon:yes gene_type:complete